MHITLISTLVTVFIVRVGVLNFNVIVIIIVMVGLVSSST